MAPLQSLSQEGTIDCIHIKWETLMRQLERTAFPCLTCCVQPGRAGEECARSVSCVNEAGAWPTWDRGQESSWLVEEKGILRSVAVWSCFLPGETEASPCLSPQSLLLCCEHGEGHRAAPAPQLGQGSSCPHTERGGMLLHRAPNSEARLCLGAALTSTPICQPRFVQVPELGTPSPEDRSGFEPLSSLPEQKCGNGSKQPCLPHQPEVKEGEIFLRKDTSPTQGGV